ncbi:uncharacterized protein B0I36DRAFT_356258 [Microdochium trichocladiopsis]|uniref:Uncharacterized protein n=1 Tax=Microdochium trichocladiopsis TaxID=1682393 RepID=A0A9P8XSI5_9PEZI|nr:uncharacterized protein B0I36DRAFT_356258 [Microdochium trichocladiopsis]KAH7012170.1 hypothetical protein B0I36DRAFT_356258 [Microdochium trichocladiopsis]
MPEKKHRDLQGPDASPANEGTRFIAAIDQAKRLQQHPLDPQDVEYGTFLATRMVLPSFRMLQSQRLDIETLGKTVPDETDQTTGALVIPWLDGDDWILFHVDKDTGAAYMFDPTPRREPSRVVAFFRQAYTDAGYGSITAMWRVPAGTRTDKWSSGWWVVEKVLMLVTGRDIKSIGFAVVKSEDVPYETDFAKTTDMIADFLQMRYVREPDQSGNRVVSVLMDLKYPILPFLWLSGSSAQVDTYAIHHDRPELVKRSYEKYHLNRSLSLDPMAISKRGGGRL